MSSPISPLTDRIARLRDIGSGMLDHPINTIESLLGFAPVNQQQQSHDAAVQQMNQQQNAHANDAANQSFQKPNLATMKKPLGK